MGKLSVVLLGLILIVLTANLGFAAYNERVSDRQYLELAIEFEAKAADTQQKADMFWGFFVESLGVGLAESLGKRYDNLAEDYRQQARFYRSLAEK